LSLLFIFVWIHTQSHAHRFRRYCSIFYDRFQYFLGRSSICQKRYCYHKRTDSARVFQIYIQQFLPPLILTKKRTQTHNVEFKMMAIALVNGMTYHFILSLSFLFETNHFTFVSCCQTLSFSSFPLLCSNNCCTGTSVDCA
jgi:hypothetical protein